MFRTLLKGLSLVSIFAGIYTLYSIYIGFKVGIYTYASIAHPTLLFPVLRAFCLLACGLLAWNAVSYAAWFSFGAFLLASSAIVQSVHTWGFFRGFTEVLPSYYLLLSIYLLLTILIWLLTRAIEKTKVAAPLTHHSSGTR